MGEIDLSKIASAQDAFDLVAAKPWGQIHGDSSSERNWSSLVIWWSPPVDLAEVFKARAGLRRVPPCVVNGIVDHIRRNGLSQRGALMPQFGAHMSIAGGCHNAVAAA